MRWATRGRTRLQFGEGSRRAETWTRRIAHDLKVGRVDEVLARLQTLQPISPESHEASDALITYYTDNATRMRYDEYLRLSYGLGSGAVEVRTNRSFTPACVKPVCAGPPSARGGSWPCGSCCSTATGPEPTGCA
jgi:hypothetical protein